MTAVQTPRRAGAGNRAGPAAAPAGHAAAGSCCTSSWS